MRKYIAFNQKYFAKRKGSNTILKLPSLLYTLIETTTTVYPHHNYNDNDNYKDHFENFFSS